MIPMNNRFWTVTWTSSSMPTIPLLKTKVRRYVFQSDEKQAEVKRTNQIENDSDDY